jgi:hypothetical protein
VNIYRVVYREVFNTDAENNMPSVQIKLTEVKHVKAYNMEGVSSAMGYASNGREIIEIGLVEFARGIKPEAQERPLPPATVV